MKIDTKGLRTIYTGLLFIGVLIISGCPQQGPGLEGTVWMLDSYVDSGGNTVSVLPNTEITAQFQNGTVGGSAGCNTYSADYQINNNTITIGAIATTRMYCAGIMDQENDYLTALTSAMSFKIEGNTLEMTNASGEVVLLFKAS